MRATPTRKSDHRRKTLRGPFARLIRDQRGQSMVSYSIITAAILGGLLTMGIIILPRMLDALSSYTKSLYFSVSMPFP